MKIKKIQLWQYINTLQSKGRYTFTREEAMKDIGSTDDAFRFAALRLIKKRRLARIVNGFYVIVPIEYQEIGLPPAAWFIDYLMKYIHQNYYVGLLSAAALYGAAHQQPQVLQIVTNKPLREINIAGIRIKFFVKKNILSEFHEPIKTPTGYMNVSTPELTSFDLIRYMKSAGYLNNVATVLSELQEKLDSQRFVNLLEKIKVEPPEVQRLGYLFELVRANKEIIEVFKKWVDKNKPRSIPLRSDKSYDNSEKNEDWRLYINEKIEVDI